MLPRALRPTQVLYFARTPHLAKSVTETVKEVANAVDKTAAGAVLKGVELGEKAAKSGSQVAGEAKGEADKVTAEAGAKVREAEGVAKEKVEK